jgi:hypothetical protein
VRETEESPQLEAVVEDTASWKKYFAGAMVICELWRCNYL